MGRNKSKIGLFFILLIGLSLFLIGCDKNVVPILQPIQEDTKPSDQQPITSLINDTGATSEGIETIVDANNQLALDLYLKYRSEEGNIFFSPYSISTALAMTYEGAKGQTAEEMQFVLHIPENANIRRANIEKIYNDINQDDKKYKLSTANALWAQEDFKFLDDYFSIVEEYYGGKVTNLNFDEKPEESRIIINNWVEDKTNNKIKDLIPVGIIKPRLTRLILTNAIYFKGNWVKQFNENDTKEQNFRLMPSNTNIKVPMIQRTDDESKFNYAENSDVQLLELPYSSEDLSMLILLPKDDNLEDLEKSFTLKKLTQWRDSLSEQRVNVYIPKFKFETKYFMAETLKDMGMPIAFSDNADFSGMTGKKDLKIYNVIHQAFVEVNEEGTEAAAATAVIMGRITSVGPEPVIPTFRADHPFIFIIQQKDSGNILFMGRVSDPTK